MEANLQPGINRYQQNWQESARNLLWWPIYNFTLADKTKLSCNTLSNVAPQFILELLPIIHLFKT